MSTAILPRDALFEAGDAAPATCRCATTTAGVEARMRKSLALQAELGPVFDITLDCEDGAPVGGEREHAHLVAELVISSANRFGRVGARVHPNDHRPSRRRRYAGRRAGDAACLPDDSQAARHLLDLQRAIEHIEAACARHGRGQALPLHALVETHGALRDVHALAALRASSHCLSA
jgi:citrate lyase subunit beta/citryl-CoA lyase